jgi:alkylhydroperoxidase/carboxymuconolactone decarboxylase family protein YurZ
MNDVQEKISIEVFDPAMCCSTGVCGPDVDEALADFANDVKWLKTNGVDVQRFNLGQEPEAFKKNPQVLSKLQKGGSEVLPIIFVNGEIVSEGGYPDRESLIRWTKKNGHNKVDSEKEKPAVSETLFTEKTEILIAIGAAVASGNTEDLKIMFEQGLESGISKDDLSKAMQTGLNIRQKPLTNIVETANELLGVPSNGCAPGSGCC